MNNVDKEYFRLLDTVLTKGRWKANRTGVRTIGVFGEQAKFELYPNFPILTTKKVWFKGVVHELLWFISGSTNIKYLVDNDVHIWDEWAYKKYAETPINELDDGLRLHEVQLVSASHRWLEHWSREDFVHLIRTNPEFAKKWGELGEGTYGWGWRNFGKQFCHHYCDDEGHDWLDDGVDQISEVIERLKTNPDDRRLIVNAWHPYFVKTCALPPCHVLFQFHTEELTFEERNKICNELIAKVSGKYIEIKHDVETLEFQKIPKRRLNCQLYQRSADGFLGVPFNISSYSLLTYMISQVVGMVPGTFTHTFGDLHIYENHIEQVNEQLRREPKTLPTLWLNPAVKSLFDFKFEDIKLKGYDSHPAIKGEVAV